MRADLPVPCSCHCPDASGHRMGVLGAVIWAQTTRPRQGPSFFLRTSPEGVSWVVDRHMECIEHHGGGCGHCSTGSGAEPGVCLGQKWAAEIGKGRIPARTCLLWCKKWTSGAPAPGGKEVKKKWWVKETRRETSPLMCKLPGAGPGEVWGGQMKVPDLLL